MINRIFKGYEEKKEKQIVKTNKVYKLIKKGQPKPKLCQNYGQRRKFDNSICQYTLEFRPSHHYLCLSCWHGRELGEGRKYYPDDFKYKDEYGYVSEEEVITEEYTECGIKLEDSTDEIFNINNELIVKTFDNIYLFSKYFKNKSSFKFSGKNLKIKFNKLINKFKSDSKITTNIDELVNNSIAWFGDKEIEDYRNFIFEDSLPNDINEKLEYIDKIIMQIHLDCIVLESKILRIPSVVGAHPNVPAYISGNPINMYNYVNINAVNIVPGITIFFNITADAKTSIQQYKHRGLICFYLMEYFISKGVNVNFQLFEGSYTITQNLLTFFNTKYDFLTNQRRKIFHALTDIEFLRLLSFQYKDNFRKLNNDWKESYGYTLKENDFWLLYEKIINKEQIISIPYDEKPEHYIFFSTPEEMGIEGLDFEKDLNSCLRKIALFDKGIEI